MLESQSSTTASSNVLPKKIKNFGTSISSKLKSSKLIEEKIKKKAFYIGNIDRCDKNILEEHLIENGIKFNFVIPVFKKKFKNLATLENQNTEEQSASLATSTSFKIIIPETEVSKLINPEIWYKSTYLHEWDFSKPQVPKPQVHKSSNKTNG